MADKKLTYNGFRTMSVWLGEFIKGLWQKEKDGFKQYIDDTQSSYAGAVYITQDEYDALSEGEKLDITKVYFIVEEE